MIFPWPIKTPSRDFYFFSRVWTVAKKIVSVGIYLGQYSIDVHYFLNFSVIHAILFLFADLTPHHAYLFSWQSLPRPRGSDAAGLLARELELHAPIEESSRKVSTAAFWDQPPGAAWCYNDEYGENMSALVSESDSGSDFLWPRKRRRAEHNAALGLVTGAHVVTHVGFTGSRRDVVTAGWKTAAASTWHKV